MSLISEYRATEAAINELKERLNSLSEDGNLQRELEFESRLRELMGEYQKALPDIIAVLDPEVPLNKASRAPKAVPAPSKRARRVKQYKNPNTGEVIETKGGNHKTLKKWKATWGADTVESWATLLD